MSYLCLEEKSNSSVNNVMAEEVETNEDLSIGVSLIDIMSILRVLAKANSEYLRPFILCTFVCITLNFFFTYLFTLLSATLFTLFI